MTRLLFRIDQIRQPAGLATSGLAAPPKAIKIEVRFEPGGTVVFARMMNGPDPNDPGVRASLLARVDTWAREHITDAVQLEEELE